MPQTHQVQAEGTCIVQLCQGVEGASAGSAVAAKSEREAWEKAGMQMASADLKETKKQLKTAQNKAALAEAEDKRRDGSGSEKTGRRRDDKVGRVETEASRTSGATTA